MNMKTFSRHGWLLIACLALSGTVRIAQAQDVDALLARMTLEEKVGQMTQLTIQAVTSTRGEPGTDQVTDMEALREAIVDRHVGSLLNVYDMALSVDSWVNLTETIHSMSRTDSRLGIPVIYGIDAVHGNNYIREATLFPQNIGLAATWDLDLAGKAAHVTALETRSVGITWNFAPVLDVGRSPLWSRFFETFGEDVYTVSEFGRATVMAMQADAEYGHPMVAATGKHFLGYSMPLSGKDRTPAWIPERMLRDIFLPSFREAVDAGLLSIMVNSAEINGIPVHADHYLLTDVLRTELGFEGIVVTDWEDIGKLVQMHRVAKDFKEAVYQSVMAGIDMAMVPYDYTFTDALIELVREGRVPEDRIDESVRRILNVKKTLGLFNEALAKPTARSLVGTPAARQASLDAARASMTLLKNDGILPSSLSGNILLAGPAAENIPMMFGSWTYTWQGTDAAAYPGGIPTLADALRNVEGASVTVAPWGDGHEPDRLRAQAYGADVAILALGEIPSVEKPGDIESLELPADQIALVKTLAETGVPVVVVLFQNRPRIIREIEPMVDAILLAYQPGPFGAQSVVEVLKGDVNPGGHLPFTYPRFSGSLVPYDHKFSDTGDVLFGWNGFHPQYAFGHGLSYTTFAYSDLAVNPSSFEDDGRVQVSVTVTNTGERAGSDVAQVFVSDLVASITPSVRRLRGFTKLHLEPGASQRVTWTLPREAFEFVGRDLSTVFETGEFDIHVQDLRVRIVL